MIDHISELGRIIQLKLHLLMRIFQLLRCTYKNIELTAEAGNKIGISHACFLTYFLALNHLSNARCT
jgi:hypothetical protein